VSEALLIGFVLGVLTSMPVAGAVSIFIVHRGLAGRVRDGLRLAAGAGVAEALWCAAVRLGVGHVLERWPGLEHVAEIGGGLILVGLGVYFLRRRVRPAGAADRQGSAERAGNFRLGFALVAGNAAVPVNWIALLAIVQSLGFTPLEGPPGAFALGVALGIFGWFTFLLVTLDFFRDRFAAGAPQRIIRAMGLLLIVTGAVVLARQIA